MSKDLNEQLWRITVSKSVIYVRYFGDWANNQTHFVFLLPQGKPLKLKNTGVIRFEVSGFEAFYGLRDLIKQNYTYLIWEHLECLLFLRLKDGGRILKSELGI